MKKAPNQKEPGTQASSNLNIRCHPKHLVKWTEKARSENLTRSQWIIRVLNEAAIIQSITD